MLPSMVRIARVLRVVVVAGIVASCGGGAGGDGGVSDGSPDVAATDGATPDGDAMASDADATPSLGPQLTRSAPIDGATNVWAQTQVTLEFDQPLDASTLRAGIDVVAVGESLLRNVALSADGREVVLGVEPPTSLPAEAVATVSAALTGVDGRPAVAASVSWTLPVWHRPDATPLATSATGVRLAGVDETAWALVLGDTLIVYRVELDGSGELGTVPTDADVRDATLLAATVGVTVVWSEGAAGGENVRAAVWDGSTFVAHAAALATGADGFDAVLVGGVVRVATRVGAELSLVDLDASGATAVADALMLVGDEVGAPFAVAAGATTPTVFVGRDAGLHGARFEGTWTMLASPMTDTTAVVAEVDGAGVDPSGDLHVAWRSSRHAHGSVLGATGFSVVGRAMNIEPRAFASVSALDVAGEEPFVWWVEDGHGVVARRRGERYEALGDMVPVLAGTDLAVAGGALTDPLRAYVDRGGAVSFERYNGASEGSQGLTDYAPATDCALPADDDPAFPTTLAATGCYADVAAGVLAPGVIPYAINSVLWSDGATKRRFLSLPAGGALGYTEIGALTAPVGTIVIKEFFLEGDAGAFPVETRFMIKRCEDGECPEPWQGYSYRWAEDGSGATLLELEDSVILGSWNTVSGPQDHIYPGRRVCTRCHGQTPGWLLGVQAGQFNRNIDYGDVVDNQLRALREAGLLEGAPASVDGLFSMPAPPDPSFDHGERTRAYLHANCAHCHRDGAVGTTTDLRYEAPLEAGGNICNRLVPGDAAASWLYVKDSVRAPERPDPFVGNPMPPLATNVADSEQLAITAAWIDGMTSCP